MTVDDCRRIVEDFDAGADGLASKSRDLTLDLLAHTDDPFSRHQFAPGHITCTALVLHPRESKVLFMFHHRLKRWLLPGGHVEVEDESLAAAAAREALEETQVRIDPGWPALLAGIDVHGIPPKERTGREAVVRDVSQKSEPFHLHHDLIWCLRAARDEIALTDEAPRVVWAAEADWDETEVAESIRNSIRRSSSLLAH